MTRTAAVSSAATRSSSSEVEVARRVVDDLPAARPRRRGPRAAARRRGPGRPGRARPRRSPHSPASTTSTAATTSSRTSPLVIGVHRVPSAALLASRREQLGLQAEHLALLLRLGVVVAEQVQDAVGAQQLQLVLGGVPGGAACRCGDLRAEHDVAEQPRLGLLVVAARRTQLVHREGQHVGRARLVHPLDVQLLHRVGVDEQHRQLGLRVDAHPVEHEPGERDQRVSRRPSTPDSLLTSMLMTSLAVGRSVAAASAAPGAGAPAGRSPSASHRLYASTMSPTSLCRTTSWLVSWQKWTSSMPSRMSWTTRSPLGVPAGRSTWVTSPVTTIFEPKPEPGEEHLHLLRARCSAPRRG